MPTNDTKQFFLVIGVNDTGSGTLTWPEDFHVVGVFDDEKRAEEHADLHQTWEDERDLDERRVYRVVDVSFYPTVIQTRSSSTEKKAQKTRG